MGKERRRESRERGKVIREGVREDDEMERKGNGKKLKERKGIERSLKGMKETRKKKRNRKNRECITPYHYYAYFNIKINRKRKRYQHLNYTRSLPSYY